MTFCPSRGTPYSLTWMGIFPLAFSVSRPGSMFLSSGRSNAPMTFRNTDDHLRNHGFFRERKEWRLSPAYDLMPTPALSGVSTFFDSPLCLVAWTSRSNSGPEGIAFLRSMFIWSLSQRSAGACSQKEILGEGSAGGIFASVCHAFEATLVDGEDDHVHLLVHYEPKVSVSALVAVNLRIQAETG